MKIDGVFSGGGVKAFSFIGALESFENKGFIFERVGGTSAGAIIAALIKARFNYKEINDMFYQLYLKELLDPPFLTKTIPFMRWIYLYFRMGLYKGDYFEQWLQQKLAEKDIYTFADIEKGHLKMIATDLTHERLIILPDDLHPIYGIDPNTFSIATAVRMSAGFPYFFMPKYLSNKLNTKSLIVDGGLLSNFPLWLFKQEKNKRPLVGITVTSIDETTNAQEINNSLQMFQAIFTTMQKAHDEHYISQQEKDHILFIPVDLQGSSSVDFSMTKVEKRRLINCGKTYADDFLTYWPK